ncbi:hypothetical protein EVAR_14325_1 [Eumeta japonica]|uniref:Uncharacterized protein n=1 Tax=Eumeta variegata TaxID=151549 RepID=A0A4C1UNU6_EUMVA|nr:hypothetical protein EVAR_14325_1 [Eumeta japonica]
MPNKLKIAPSSPDIAAGASADARANAAPPRPLLDAKPETASSVIEFPSRKKYTREIGDSITHGRRRKVAARQVCAGEAGARRHAAKAGLNYFYGCVKKFLRRRASAEPIAALPP